MPLFNKFPRRPWRGDLVNSVSHRTSALYWIAALAGGVLVSGLIFYVLGFRAGEHALRQAGWLHRRLDDAAGEIKSRPVATSAISPYPSESNLATAVPAPAFPADVTTPPVRITHSTHSLPSRLPPAGNRDARVRSYTVQVFAGKSKTNAQSMVVRLKKMGLPVIVLPPDTATGLASHYYRVQAGPYESKAQAAAVLRRLHKRGISAFLND